MGVLVRRQSRGRQVEMTSREPEHPIAQYSSGGNVSLHSHAPMIAGFGIVVLFWVALFIITFVAPVVRTHRVLRRYSFAAVVEELGGPKLAAQRLSFYSRLPLWIAPERREAIAHLCYCGEEGLPALTRALKDQDGRVREAAAGALRYVDSDVVIAVPALRAALEDEKPYVRRSAAITLGIIGSPAASAVPELARMMMNDTDWHNRNTAVAALGRIGPSAQDMVPLLEKMLRDEQLRPEVERTLRKIRGWAYPDEKPKGEDTPAPAPKTPASPAPEGVEEQGPDAP